jgi:hypothetical protein
MIMPGGLTMARQVKPSLNESIYVGNYFAQSSTVRIANATGMVVRYDVPLPSSLLFNLTTECVYAQAQGNNGLQVCLKQDGKSMVVGK